MISGWLQNEAAVNRRGHVTDLRVPLYWDLSNVPLSSQTDEQPRRARTQTAACRYGGCHRGDSSLRLEHCVSCEENFSIYLFEWVFAC